MYNVCSLCGSPLGIEIPSFRTNQNEITNSTRKKTIRKNIYNDEKRKEKTYEQKDYCHSVCSNCLDSYRNRQL